MDEADLVAAAQAAIKEFGDAAVDVMERRAAAHRRANERDGEEFWRRVAEKARKILADRRK